MSKTSSEGPDADRVSERARRIAAQRRSAPNPVAAAPSKEAAASSGLAAAQRGPTDILRSYFSRLRDEVKVAFLKSVDEDLLRAAGYAPIPPEDAAPAPRPEGRAAAPIESDKAERRRAERVERGDHVVVVVDDGAVVFEGQLVNYSRFGARVSLQAGAPTPAQMKIVESNTGRAHRARKIWSENGEVGIEFIT